MILFVYDAALERCGLVEDITSLQWLAEYQDAGEAKLVCAATSKNLDLLRDGYRLWCSDHTESAIIRHIEISDDSKAPSMTVRAVFSAARWGDRVVMGTEQITGTERGMLDLTVKNRRGLPGVTAGAKGLSQTSETQVTWGSVLDAEKTLAASSGLGFRETFDPLTGQETFEVYEGLDRTGGDGYNGYYGDDVRNLAAVRIRSGSADWKNTAIVGGEGEGADRRILTVSLGEYSGDDLREMWVDADDIRTTYQIATEREDGGFDYTTGTYTDEEYSALLEARGLEKLAENLQTLEVDADLGQGLIEYGKDYFLGDVIPLKLTRYGLMLAARVSSVRTVYESTGRTVTAVLSEFSITKEALKL